MTKEGILKKHSIGCANGQIEFEWESAFNALDEYAKQQAIALARFINSKFELHGDNYTCLLGDGEVYSPEEIYNLFIEQQNKDNG